MSHFCTLVLIPRDCPDPEEKVTELLAPYDENGEWSKEGSRWDWWQIGGRWTGAMSDYEPHEDPENIETCDLCHGTGTRTDLSVPNGCNGCYGEGTRLKWPTQWKNVPEKDMIPAVDVPADFIPFALITPDGKWREKGRMGWFGCSRDEVEPEDWETTFRAQLGEWSESIAVVVDCHV